MATLVRPSSFRIEDEPDPRDVPELENGDRLTGAEFMRRYDAMPDLKKAELIDGRVYMASPVKQTHHGGPHADAVGLLAFYRAFTTGVEVGDNATTLLDPDNIPQPDIFLRVQAGGQSSISKEGYIAGAPELVFEVASTSVQYDLHEKYSLYQRTGVREYLVWRTREKGIDVFVLTDGVYVRADTPADGIYRSSVFPGLWLNVPAMLRRDMAAVLRTAQEGVASPEHETFVNELARRATPR